MIKADGREVLQALELMPETSLYCCKNYNQARCPIIHEAISMDTADFMILKAILDLRVAYPRAEKINSIVRLDPEELGARLGALEMEGYIRTQSGTDGSSLPGGISAAKITDAGRRVLTGGRW